MYHYKYYHVMYPIKQHSWTIYNPNVFVKLMDKSSFIYKGSGIPKEIIPFWEVEPLEPGGRKYLNLIYRNKKYDMRIERERIHYRRVRMFWDLDLAKVISEKFPKHYDRLINDQPCDDFPSMRFNKIDKYNYEVEFINNLEDQISFKNEDYEITLREGEAKYSYGTKYERDPRYRRIALEHHGTSCIVCGFNFESVYGELGEGFIEFHHINPLYINGKATVFNPYTDLVPICSNCHSIIHRHSENVLSTYELQSSIKPHK